MSTPLPVAIFTDNDFGKVNGVTTALSAVLAWTPADLRTRVYTASRLALDAPDYLALSSWGVGIPFYSEMEMYWPPYREFLRRLTADAIGVLHLTTPGPIGLAAVAAARRLKLPIVGSFHTDLAGYTSILSGSAFLGEFMRRYMRWLYTHCDTVLVPSAATLDLVAATGVPRERLGIWGRGVDTTHFTPARRSADLRAHWRADDERPVLLYVGRISREKGIDGLPALHEALELLGVRHRLVVVGDGPLRCELVQRCPGAVFTGVLGREALADVYASADVFLFPSRTDTAGNVVLEAQASGLPVVVSDAGGPREQMREEVTGLVCEHSPAAWITATSRLLTDAALRRQMSSAARALAEERQWSAALAPLFAAYRRAGGMDVTSPVAATPTLAPTRHVA